MMFKTSFILRSLFVFISLTSLLSSSPHLLSYPADLHKQGRVPSSPLLLPLLLLQIFIADSSVSPAVLLITVCHSISDYLPHSGLSGGLSVCLCFCLCDGRILILGASQDFYFLLPLTIWISELLTFFFLNPRYAAVCVVCADGLDVMRFCRFLFIGPRESEEAWCATVTGV